MRGSSDAYPRRYDAFARDHSAPHLSTVISSNRLGGKVPSKKTAHSISPFIWKRVGSRID